MKKRIIMIMVSVFLILLSLLSINQKLIEPSRKNREYEKQIEESMQMFEERIRQNSQEKEKAEEEIRQQTNIVIPIPTDDQEKCKRTIGLFFHNINIKNYEQSYKLLDKKFKENYFPTLDTFVAYCQEKYTDYKVLEYIKYERRTDYLLVKIIVKSLNNSEEQNEMQINIADKGNNVFTISFGVEQ